MPAPVRAYDPIRYHRGTRGFAALVTTFSGFVVLAVSLLVVPGLSVDRGVATWAILLGSIAGIAHLVAAVGLIRGRRWAAELVGYLAAAGIAVSLTTALMTATDLDPFHVDRGTTIAVALWLSFWWLVAVRFAIRPFSFARPWSSVGSPVPLPRLSRPARRSAPSAVWTPSPRREPLVLYPVSTPTA
jgi:hypothetical protein